MPLPKLLWTPSPNLSDRSPDHIDLLCVHCCEGSYAGSVSWFAQKKSEVSAHIVLNDDGTEATYMVDLDKKAWHACLFNSRSIGLEMAGWAKNGFGDNELQADAAIAAYVLRKYDIPLRWAQKGVGPGVCRHFDLGQAGGGHLDPTTDDGVWNNMMLRIEAAYRAMPTIDPTWLTNAEHAVAPAMPLGFKPSLTVRSDEAPHWPEPGPVLDSFLSLMARAFNQWRHFGWSKDSACGLVAGIEVVGNPVARYGWDDTRRGVILAGCGIDVWKYGPIEEQVTAANWELHGTERVALVKIDNADEAGVAGFAVGNYYVRAGTLMGSIRTQRAAQRWAAYLSTDEGKALLAANPV